MRQFRPFVVLPVVLAAVLLPGSAYTAARATPLTGTVGPGFTIMLNDASGSRVTQLDPGQYSITIHDLAVEHNFHLKGPGSVDKATSVEGTGDVTWDVTLVDGVYNYRCDVHASMHGSFRVGPAPPPPPKLNGQVGPKKTISLKTAAGSSVKALAAGTYKIVVRDSTKTDNFHLLGPGVSKRTGVRSRGTSTWTVTFRAGKYVYRSDAHPKLRKTFTVS